MATIAALLCLCGGDVPTAGAQGDKHTASRGCLDCLQAALPGMLERATIPGIAVAVIQDGRVVWSGGAGVRDLQSREAVSADTIFRGASLGKPIFAYAVLKLVDARRLALDTPLVRYAPQAYLETRFFKGAMSDPQLSQITARMVLSHTSGLPNWRSPGEPLRVGFPPGSRYSYSGEGYLLLQRVVEHLTGQSLDAFMQATVFGPLGMTRTTYTSPAAAVTNVATSYGANGDRVTPPVDEEPNVAHTVWTTAADYGRFLVAIMGGSGLQSETRREMLRAQTSTDVCRSGAVSWGLGFAVERAPAGEDAFLQWGRSPDSTGYALGYGNRQDAVVYVTNVAVRGLTIGERVVQLAVGHDDPLFACFGIRSYDAK